MIFLIIFLILTTPAWAQENPQSKSAAVTASVISQGEPDTPVLISPTNNSVIASKAPSFIFNPSLGSIGVGHYQLWVDGSKNTDHIPQSFNTIVTQAQSALSEGTHTWLIKAIGVNGVNRNSTTWTFTIDTTAPLILINQVAEHQTSLSSLDLTPWNHEVSFTTNNPYPIFGGQGEAQATLTISLIGPTTTDTINVPIGADRTFSVKPNVALPAGRYTVSVASTDPAGNATSLPTFYLVISSPKKAFTISLPSPLPKLTLPITIPPILTPVTVFPVIPAAPEQFNALIWLVVIAYLSHIFCLNRLICRLYLHHHIRIYQYIILYITILLPTGLLGIFAWQLKHWLPTFLTILSLGLLVYEFKLTKSKDITIEQE